MIELNNMSRRGLLLDYVSRFSSRFRFHLWHQDKKYFDQIVLIKKPAATNKQTMLHLIGLKYLSGTLIASSNWGGK